MRVVAFAIAGGICAVGPACQAFGSDPSSSPPDASTAPVATTDASSGGLSEDAPYDASMAGLPADCLSPALLTDDFERDAPGPGSPWGTQSESVPFLSIDRSHVATGSSSLLVLLSNANATQGVDGALAAPVTPRTTGSLCVTMAFAIEGGDLSSMSGYASLLDLRAAEPGGESRSVAIDVDHRGLFLKNLAEETTIDVPRDGRFRRWAFVVSKSPDAGAGGTISVYAGDTVITRDIDLPFVPTTYNVAIGADIDTAGLVYPGPLAIHFDALTVH